MGSDFNAQLRALVETHRGKLGTLVALESKLETQRATATAKIDRKLATVRSQREAAQGTLHDVEEILNARPPLPGIEPAAAESLERAENITPEETSAELDMVNQ